MSHKIILLDFAGTLIRRKVIEEANEFRSKILQRSDPSAFEHAHSETLYQANREFVATLTGLSEDMAIWYRQMDHSRRECSGKELQNSIATTLFQIGMFAMAKKYGINIIEPGLLEQLQRVTRKGYTLAIVSGVREDIISGMLAIAKIPVSFEFVYGQPPCLGIAAETTAKELREHGQISYCLGDKHTNLQLGKDLGAKTIFVTWGHAMGGEEAFADFSISDPEELEQIIQ